jgi:hypothetical protein
MTALLIVLANPQRAAQFLALFNLGLRQLVHLMTLQTSRARSTSIACLLSFEFLAQSVALVIDRVLVNPVAKAIVSIQLFLPRPSPSLQKSSQRSNPEKGRNSPLVLQPIPQLKNFHFNLPFPLVLDDSLVRLALAVLEVFDSARRRVRRGVVAGFEVRAVALHVA